MMNPCEQEFKAWLSKYGRSTCDGIMREHLRKRLDVESRPARIRVSLSARRDMYARQDGRCAICGQPMPGKNLSALDVDHVNPNLTGSAFNHRSNLRLAHSGCNRSKGAVGIMDQARKYNKTAVEILGDEP